MSKKHTPGPWKLFVDAKTRAISIAKDNSYWRIPTMPLAEFEANLALVAAAPDLLEAAKAMQKHILDKGWSTAFEFETLNKLSAAIAKAEGRE